MTPNAQMPQMQLPTAPPPPVMPSAVQPSGMSRGGVQLQTPPAQRLQQGAAMQRGSGSIPKIGGEGRGYGPSGKWIHDRAHRIMREGEMSKQYGKERGKSVAYAIATQQAHKVGKSPKTFVSKQTGRKERFGTPVGKAIAKAKHDLPKRVYQKTAGYGTTMSEWLAKHPTKASRTAFLKAEQAIRGKQEAELARQLAERIAKAKRGQSMVMKQGSFPSMPAFYDEMMKIASAEFEKESGLFSSAGEALTAAARRAAPVLRRAGSEAAHASRRTAAQQMVLGGPVRAFARSIRKQVRPPKPVSWEQFKAQRRAGHAAESKVRSLAGMSLPKLSPSMAR